MNVTSSRFATCILGALVAGLTLLVALLLYCNSQLPDVSQLLEVPLQAPTRIYSQEGLLIGELGELRRTPVPLQQVPPLLVAALVHTEDQRFFEHHGVDVRGLARAVLHSVKHRRKEQGASTLTMQVARNFFLSREKTFSRKIREILLALKIDRNLSKETILELYLNKVYFGKGAYGVAAAAEVYFGAPLHTLTLPQMALLAGLPQAPSAINPRNNPEAAKRRRNHVLYRMHQAQVIDQEAYHAARQAAVTCHDVSPLDRLDAPYFLEHIRQHLQKMYGATIYDAGWSVYTTLNEQAQHHAERALHDQLEVQAQQHEFQGPVAHLPAPEEGLPELIWQDALTSWEDHGPRSAGVLVHVTDSEIKAMDRSGTVFPVARPGAWICGRQPSCSLSQVLHEGDVFYFRTPMHTQERILTLKPRVNGALVALNPHTGAILAMVGGSDFKSSPFNRTTQAFRQAGSVIKPLIYTSALLHGYTPASVFNDAPLTRRDASQKKGWWQPQNSSRTFSGPLRLREALIRSRNLVSVRVLDAVGIQTVSADLMRFGLAPSRLPQNLSLALGTAPTTPMEIARSYATFINRGFLIEPHGVHHIEDMHGSVIEAHKAPWALSPEQAVAWSLADWPLAPRIVPEHTAYRMQHMLKEVIQHGTGRGAQSIGRFDLGGKTGTTNHQMDAWFSGVHPEVVCTTWMGHDTPESLHAYAAQTALPMWAQFMKHFLKGHPEMHVPQAEHLVATKIDPQTGRLASDEHAGVFEWFTPEERARLKPAH